MPGYVKCPRCHRPLPMSRPRATGDASGVVLAHEPKRFPVMPVAVAVAVGLGIVLVFALRRGPHAPPPAAEPPPSAVVTADGTTLPPARAATPAPQVAPSATDRPEPGPIAAALARSLDRQHLWSSVDVIGDRAEIRSGSCKDPALQSAVEGVHAAFKAAGLTRLRCLEQSGVVVFDRAL